MTAAELKQKALVKPYENVKVYAFNESEMQTFIDQVCKEQRKRCAESMAFTQSLEEKIEAVLNATKPVGL